MMMMCLLHGVGVRIKKVMLVMHLIFCLAQTSFLVPVRCDGEDDSGKGLALLAAGAGSGVIPLGLDSSSAA